MKKSKLIFDREEEATLNLPILTKEEKEAISEVLSFLIFVIVLLLAFCI